MSEMCFDDFDYDRHSDSCECEKCTPENIESPSHSLQQLKAEITALCDSFVRGRRDLFLDEFASKYERLRKLSAV